MEKTSTKRYRIDGVDFALISIGGEKKRVVFAFREQRGGGRLAPVNAVRSARAVRWAAGKYRCVCSLAPLPLPRESRRRQVQVVVRLATRGDGAAMGAGMVWRNGGPAVFEATRWPIP